MVEGTTPQEFGTQPEQQPSGETQDQQPAGGQQDQQQQNQATPPTQLDARLQSAARRAHLSDDAVKAMGDSAPQVLGQLADSFDKLSADFGELGRLKSQLPPADNQNGPPQPNAQNQNAQAVAEQILDDSRFTQADRDRLVTPIKKSLEQQTNRLQTAERQLQELVASNTAQKVDRFFESRPEAQAIVGKGPSDSLLPGSPEREAREAIMNSANAIRNGYEAAGKQYPLESALNDAFILELGKRKSLGDQVANRQQQVNPSGNAPAGRPQEEVTEQSAIEATRAKMSELGYP